MYSYHHPKLVIREIGGKGIGLFTTAAIAKGELLVVTGGRVIATAALKNHSLPEHPFQIEKDFLISPPENAEKEGIFCVNHSCDPTAGIRGQTSLIARRNIDPGEEITYDYVMTDSDPSGIESFRMDCLCGSSQCRKVVSDTDWRRTELRARYRGYFSSYLQARIDSEG